MAKVIRPSKPHLAHPRPPPYQNAPAQLRYIPAVDSPHRSDYRHPGAAHHPARPLPFAASAPLQAATTAPNSELKPAALPSCHRHARRRTTPHLSILSRPSGPHTCHPQPTVSRATDTSTDFVHLSSPITSKSVTHFPYKTRGHSTQNPRLLLRSDRPIFVTRQAAAAFQNS